MQRLTRNLERDIGLRVVWLNALVTGRLEPACDDGDDVSVELREARDLANNRIELKARELLSNAFSIPRGFDRLLL